MRLGLISDIHEDVGRLRAAAARFEAAAVDRVVMLGDVYENGERIAETCELLGRMSRDGVWGNHDFGLCRDVEEDLAARMDPGVLAYMATLRPNLVIADCFIQHVEPWLDPERLEDLWQHFGPADSTARVDDALRAVPQRVIMMGHLHRWVVADEDGIIPWDGAAPIVLAPVRRHFVALGAVCDGWGATYDTDSGLLVPLWLG